MELKILSDKKKLPLKIVLSNSSVNGLYINIKVCGAPNISGLMLDAWNCTGKLFTKGILQTSAVYSFFLEVKINIKIYHYK